MRNRIDRVRRNVLAGSATLGLGLMLGPFGCRAVGQWDDEIDEEARDDMPARDADPRLADYEMPTEDQPHERTFMQWPVNPEVYDRRSLGRAQATIALIANTIGEFEPVVMLVSEEHAEDARAQLGDSVELWDIPTDDLWCRDSGPTFVKNDAGELAVAHFHFNGWGDK